MTDKLKIEFTSKELNYIAMALLSRVHSLKGDESGNVPHIRRVSKRVYNKICRERGLVP